MLMLHLPDFRVRWAGRGGLSISARPGTEPYPCHFLPEGSRTGHPASLSLHGHTSVLVSFRTCQIWHFDEKKTFWRLALGWDLAFAWDSLHLCELVSVVMLPRKGKCPSFSTHRVQRPPHPPRVQNELAASTEVPL